MSDATRSGDFSRTYYNDAHLGGYDNYVWENEDWRRFFLSVADRVVGMTNPRTVLDVGCARGLLVQALVSRGVDATGIDISDHAVTSAHEDVRDRLRVASATDAIEQRYDLVSCIEVLEHLSPVDAQLAMDNIAAATDLVLFSSSPADHGEATHINTRPTAQWAAWFAERGLFRRTDVDLSFLSPWAVLFERADLTVHALTQRYEQQFAVVNTELVEKRSALLESHRRIATLTDQLRSPVSDTVSEQAAQLRQWEDEVHDARHHLLTTRDHIIGTESEVARLTADLKRLRGELAKARKQTQSVRGRLKETRGRIARLTRRNEQLTRELDIRVARASFARRVVRRLRGRPG